MFFKTMEDLVQYYKKRNKGLITRLRYPVQRKQVVHDDSLLQDEPDYESKRRTPFTQHEKIRLCYPMLKQCCSFFLFRRGV